MPSCRSCNLRKRDMSLEQFRLEITRKAKGLLNGKASFPSKDVACLWFNRRAL